MLGSATSVHSETTADQMRNILEMGLGNRAQLHALQDEFFGLKWNERHESVTNLKERLSTVLMVLQTAVSDEALYKELNAELSFKIPDKARLVTEDFDAVVSAVLELIRAQPASLSRESETFKNLVRIASL